jgi:hypothetical protein
MQAVDLMVGSSPLALLVGRGEGGVAALLEFFCRNLHSAHLGEVEQRLRNWLDESRAI